MSDPSDWEPLPEPQRAAHPGEFVELARRPAAPAPAPSPAPPPPSAPDPAAERAFAALKAKIAQAPPGQSLVAELCRREAKAERKQRAAGSVALAACAPVAAVAPTSTTAAPVPNAPLEVQFAPGIDGRDGREDEPWFRQLPAAEQDRLRKAWALRREQIVEDRPGQRRARNRRFVASLLVFTAVWAAGTSAWWHATFGAGIVCGLWWRHAAPCRYRDPILALFCLLVANVVAWIASGSDSMPPGSFMDAVLLVAFASLVGFDGEIRQTGGFDQN